MISQRDVFGPIHDALAGLHGIDGRVWIGDILDDLPTDSQGRILPGVRMQLRVPSPLDDLPVSDEQLLDARRFWVQTTCFAADTWVLMDAVDAVIETLTGLRIGRGQLIHDTTSEPVQPYLWDTTINPHRPYSPLYWRIDTQ